MGERLRIAAGKIFPKNRRGDEIVEAAMVLPIMILTILSLILLMIYFYARLETQCELHRELIESAQNSSAVYTYIEDRKKTSSGLGGVTSMILTSECEDGIRVIDEAKIIRMGDFGEN